MLDFKELENLLDLKNDLEVARSNIPYECSLDNFSDNLGVLVILLVKKYRTNKKDTSIVEEHYISSLKGSYDILKVYHDQEPYYYVESTKHIFKRKECIENGLCWDFIILALIVGRYMQRCLKIDYDNLEIKDFEKILEDFETFEKMYKYINENFDINLLW